MNNINKNFERPDEKWIDKFSEIPTPVIGDVMNRHNILHSRIRPAWSGAKICGPALTITTYPSDNFFIHLGLKIAQKNDVLVIDANNYQNAGLWGEILTINAINKNINGVVIDGSIRDIKEIEAAQFPVFSSGVSARGGFKSNPGKINTSISCGGVAINAGDFIVGDENGVAVIPKSDIEEFYDECIQKLKDEEKIVLALEQGKDTFEIMNLEKELNKLNIDIR